MPKKIPRLRMNAQDEVENWTLSEEALNSILKDCNVILPRKLSGNSGLTSGLTYLLSKMRWLLPRLSQSLSRQIELFDAAKNSPMR